MKKYKKLKPIETSSLVDKVEIAILNFMKENQLTPGDPIPKELEFSKSLNVSRTVVREALTRLRTLGLIDSKKHRGIVIVEPDFFNNFERIVDSGLLGQSTLKNLFELRLILEMGMADFLFEYKTSKDLIELEEIVEKEEREELDKTFFSLDKEIAFHGKLYQISRNKTLQRFQDLLLPVFEFVHENNPDNANSSYKYSSGKFITHRMLMENLKVGTPETFRNAMRQHLEPHFESVFKNKKIDK